MLNAAYLPTRFISVPGSRRRSPERSRSIIFAVRASFVTGLIPTFPIVRWALSRTSIGGNVNQVLSKRKNNFMALWKMHICFPVMDGRDNRDNVAIRKFATIRFLVKLLYHSKISCRLFQLCKIKINSTIGGTKILIRIYKEF